jgi:uncharacterized protein (DUF302 family)
MQRPDTFARERALPGVSFEDAIARVKAALAKEGFGVLTEIDVKATLKSKLDADFRPYVILGACNPVLAHRALRVDPKIGVLLPCNVVVEELPDGAVGVLIADARAMFSLVENAELEGVAKEADARLSRVADALA